MREPVWIDRSVLLLLHHESLAEHGGSTGIRDVGLFDSALARPQNQFHYDPEADLAQLASAYGYGLARNHAFVDGNKRIAFIATDLFMRLNGYKLLSDAVNEIQTMLKVAAGEISEEEFAAWICANSKKRG